MKAWIFKNKGYIIHGIAVAVIFLDPSVKAFFASHLQYAGPGLILEGWLLHWATGK